MQAQPTNTKPHQNPHTMAKSQIPKITKASCRCQPDRSQMEGSGILEVIVHQPLLLTLQPTRLQLANGECSWEKTHNVDMGDWTHLPLS